MSARVLPAMLRGAARWRTRAWRLTPATIALFIACAGDDVNSRAAGAAVHDTAATADGAGPVRILDDAGRTVTLPRPARRVISLIPAQTEIVSILAGANVLIARTAWDRDPALAHLPSIGNALTPSVEWLAAQQPDLIIAWPDAHSRDVVQRLASIGIPVYASRVESVAQIRDMIRRLGVLLGADARADSVIRSIDAELDAVRAAVAGRPRRSVLYLLSADPPMVAGAGTYVDELITIAGGRNAFGDLTQPWPQVALEEIVRRQPDVIIRPSDAGTRGDLRTRAGWRELAAVRDGRVFAVSADLYNRPGATVGLAARGLAERIHADRAR